MAKGGRRLGAGAKRKPRELKLLEGTFRKERDGHTPPVVGGFPAAPDDLTPSEAALWAMFPRPSWIGETDALAVRAAVSVYDRILATQRAAREAGDPLSKVEVEARLWGRLMGILSALGLTPADRGKIHAPKPEAVDQWAELLG